MMLTLSPAIGLEREINLVTGKMCHQKRKHINLWFFFAGVGKPVFLFQKVHMSNCMGVLNGYGRLNISVKTSWLVF